MSVYALGDAGHVAGIDEERTVGAEDHPGFTADEGADVVSDFDSVLCGENCRELVLRGSCGARVGRVRRERRDYVMCDGLVLMREWLAADDSVAVWQLHSKHAKTSSDRHARRGRDHGAIQEHAHGVEGAPASGVFHAQHDRHNGSRRLQCARAVL